MTSRKSGSGFGYGHRRLGVEALEKRTLLAGNVFVDKAGPNLIVRGDNADNLVVITEGENPGEYVVIGLDFDDAVTGGDFDGGPTNLTGDGEEIDFNVRLVTGITGDIIVDLKKGDDVLGISNSEEDLTALAEECGIGFGFGSASGSASFPSQVEPEITGDRFIVPGSLVVNSGDGNDGVFIIADVRNDVVVTTGNGFDAVGIGFSNTEHEEHSVVKDDVIINTGKHDDLVCIHGLFVEDQLVVDTGDGSDQVFADGWDARGATVVTGNQNDLVELFSFDLDNQLVINTGNGHDDVLIEDFSAGQGNGPNGGFGAGYVTVVTGNGDDNVEMFFFDASGVTINTGAGNDGTPDDESPITVNDAEIFTDRNDNGEFDEGDTPGPLTIVTGAGNDLVEVFSVSAGNITIDTGAGNDGTSDQPILLEDFFVVRAVVLVTGAGNDFALVQFGEMDNAIVNLGAGHDELFIFDVDVNNDATIDAGAGNDTVSIEESEVDDVLLILMGAGNDELNIFGSTGRRLRAFGGSGFDTFNNDLGVESNGDDGDVEVRQFEEFNLD